MELFAALRHFLATHPEHCSPGAVRRS
jgi:hypothetical protein